MKNIGFIGFQILDLEAVDLICILFTTITNLMFMIVISSSLTLKTEEHSFTLESYMRGNTVGDVASGASQWPTQSSQ